METLRSLRWRQVHVSARTTWTFVEIETSAGRIGTGEASVPCRHDEVIARIDQLRALLEGTPMNAGAPRLPELLPSATLPETAASCAIDQALFDLEAGRLGRPIAALLGVELRSRVDVYANVNRRTADRSPHGFAASAAAAIAAGMTSVKIAPFDRVRAHMSSQEARPLLAAACDRIAAVRAAIGRESRLMIDCHWRLNPSMVEDVIRAAAEHAVFWIETPLAEVPELYADIRRARALANAAGMRLAGGELEIGRAGFAPLVQGDLYDVLMPDITFVGGYEAFLLVAEAAAARGMLVSPHNPTGPICHAHSVQASAVVPGFLHLETQFDETPLFASIVDGHLPNATAGSLDVPRAHGLGVRLRSEALPVAQRATAGERP